jgi:hypothetical protein
MKEAMVIVIADDEKAVNDERRSSKNARVHDKNAAPSDFLGK